MMDRRTFMTAGVGLVAVGGAMSWLDGYGNRDDPSGRVLVLVDSTLSASRAFLAESNEACARCIEIGSDVGALWYLGLRGWLGAINGGLRPSDCFVLRNLSICDGRAFRSRNIGPEAIAFEIGAGNREGR